MCQLGLNDVIYLVPEFTPSAYQAEYQQKGFGDVMDHPDFQGFFEHYHLFNYQTSGVKTTTTASQSE